MKIQWTCTACKTPNVLTTIIGERYTLTCGECGHPADILDDNVDLGYGTCSTSTPNPRMDNYIQSAPEYTAKELKDAVRKRK